MRGRYLTSGSAALVLALAPLAAQDEITRTGKTFVVVPRISLRLPRPYDRLGAGDAQPRLRGSWLVARSCSYNSTPNDGCRLYVSVNTGAGSTSKWRASSSS